MGTVTLLEALSLVAQEARIDGRADPVIETDMASALKLARLMVNELGEPMLRQPTNPERVIAMYDGVKIVARRPQVGQHEVDGWREHFGPLADIWS